MHASEPQKAHTVPASVDFLAMLAALKHVGPSPSAPAGEEIISTIQTHASMVLLSKTYVYKLKKPKFFGFFDYSTPLLRRHFCQQEVCLNRVLAPHVYLGIAPVLTSHTEQFQFGPIFAPEHVPMPGAELDGGLVVDYAVVMVRLPDSATLESMVQADIASPELLKEIAHVVAAFHMQSHWDKSIAHWGDEEVIEQNWEENFTQVQPYIGRTIDEATYKHIASYVQQMLAERAWLFEHRVHEGRIRDCHGDLRLQHIYALDAANSSTKAQLVILDRIEFNERFRYSDVASEIAFLIMELEQAGRSDLSRIFIDAYIEDTGDNALKEVLPFYACYRAFVRGKVLSFQLDEQEVSASQREQAARQAQELFALAAHYATAATKATLLMVGGLMGTGKSTLAVALQRELGWQLLSSDLVRKHIAAVDPEQPQANAFGQGIYSSQWTELTYHTLREEARAALMNGCSVILDASFSRRADRLALFHDAALLGAVVVFVECSCPREIALVRLARRWQAHIEEGDRNQSLPSAASDGRPELYQAQAGTWEAYIPEVDHATQHMMIVTTQSISASVEHILALLDIPRLICYLQE